MIKKNTWGKKPLSLLLAAVLILTLLPATVLAEDSNSYGHPVTYEPLTSLKYKGKTVMFFDYSLSQFPAASGSKSSMVDQFTKLIQSGYSFNSFGERISASNTAKAPETFNGEISGLKNYNASYKFDVPSANQYEYYFGGNIRGWNKKTGFITFYNQWEKASFSFMGFSHSTENDDYYHGTKNSGYDISKNSNWKSSMKMSDLKWRSNDNDFDNNNRAKLGMGMVLGRDTEGPMVKSIIMTDSGGNAIPGNVITLDWLSKHPDRTIYFKLTLSEPVKFENDVDPKDVALNIRTLGMDGTEGLLAKAAFLHYAPEETGNSSMSETEMIFEYKVPNPYTDNSPVTQERGLLYSFTRVNINASDNPVLFNKMRDISGNVASTSKEGEPTPYSVAMNGKVDILPLSIAFGEKTAGIDIYRESETDTGKEFINQSELIKIQLTFNKPLALKYTDYTKLPSITLNIKDKEGEYITITPTAYDDFLKRWYKSSITQEWTQSSSQSYAGTWRIINPADPYSYIQAPNALISSDGKSITYYYQAVPGHTFLEEDRIEVIEVNPNAGTKDASGYELLKYKRTGNMLVPANAPSIIKESEQRDAKNLMKGVVPAHRYKLDFKEPSVDVDAALEGGVAVFTANVDDANLEGCYASFNISFNGKIDGTLGYKPSNSLEYDDNNWSQTGTMVSADAPIVEGKAYMLVKLPQAAEFDAATVTVTVADEAGNSGTKTKTLPIGYDTLSPRITLTQQYDIDAPKPYNNYAAVDVLDISGTTVTYAWTDEEDSEPDNASYSEAGTEIRYTANDLNENKIYEKTLWVKAADKKGNIGRSQMNFSFNNTCSDVNVITANNTDLLTKDVYPEATIKIQNAKAYWYAWAETTGAWTATWGALSGSTAADYVKAGLADNASGIYYRREGNIIAFSGELTDEDPEGEGYQNEEEISITAGESTKVLKHLKMGSLTEGGTGFQGTGDGISLNAADMLDISDTTRPLELLVAYLDSDDVWHVESIPFDTFYNTPEISNDPIRFSTNNRFGVREDTYRLDLEKRYESYINYFENDSQYFNRPGLGWADESRSYNMPNIYGFAEVEFALGYDNVTGLDRVKDIEVSLVKVKKPIYDLPYDVETVSTWSIDKNSLTPMGDMLYYGTNEGEESRMEHIGNISKNLYSYTVSFDPGTIDKIAYEIDEYGMEYLISYEFRTKYTYVNNASETFTTAKFVFDNNGWEIGRYESIQYNLLQRDSSPKLLQFENTQYDSPYTKFGALAVFNGDELVSNVPVVPFNENSTINLYIKAQNVYTLLHELTARQRIAADYLDTEGRGLLGTGLVMRVGTLVSEGKILNQTILNSGEESSDGSFEFVSEGNLPVGSLDEEGEAIVYYQLVDIARNIEGSINAVKLKKDNTPPVVELSASVDNSMPASEVYVRITSVTDESDVEMMYDTPYAVQFGTPQNVEELYYSDYNPGFFLTPDEDGGYTFTGNGFIVAIASDRADNKNETLIVNGTETPKYEDDINRLDTYAVYHITNIDREPPEFTSEPLFTANADGSFDISAKVSSDVSRAYIKFDKAYTELLTGETYEKDTDIPAFEFDNVMGKFDGKFNKTTHEINGKIYIMSDEKIKMTQATLIIEDEAGNSAISEWKPNGGLAGIEPKITNLIDPDKKVPVYKYAENLSFTVPVKLTEFNTSLNTAHSSLPIYSDGVVIITYTDIFNRYFTQKVYADIFGGSHTFTVSPTVPTNGAVTIEIIPSKGFTVSTYKTKMTENGNVTYTITPADGGSAQSYSIPITNIDKTAPQANVSVAFDSTEDAAGNVYLYSAVYSLTGFSEEDVTVIGASSVSFDAMSDTRTHTFTFYDAAGNVGTFDVDASDLTFVNPDDTKIAAYRLTYLSGELKIGEYTLGQEEPLTLTPSNTDISVKVEALNAAGSVVPSKLSEQPVFTCESGTVSDEQSKTVTITGVGNDNSINATVLLPDDAIDKMAPVGSVDYRPQTTGSVRVYLVHSNNDLADDGIKLIGQDKNGIPFELLSDGDGYYVEFTSNGTGYFLLRDKAGNTSTIALAVASIDNDPPELGSEGWSSLINATSRDLDFAQKLQQIITTPTNNSIKLFLSFNEQIYKADFDVYSVKANDVGSTAVKLTNKGDYALVTVSGSSVVVEFLQNCQLRLTVYDIRNNSYTVWRPEDGPIIAIDKGAPKITNTPSIVYKDNKASITYEFDEEVTLTQNAAASYQSKHNLTFDANGTFILTFADKAGNVVSTYPVVDKIDDIAPVIIPELEYAGSGQDFGMQGTAGFYTSKDAKFTVRLEDSTTDGLALLVKRLSGFAVTVTDGEFTITENGVYTITATDKWGQANSVNVSIDAIDKTAPSIRLASTEAVQAVPGTSPDEVKSSLLEGVTATDLQSGVAPGFPSVSLEGVDLSKPGAYTATITVTDNCGNTATALRSIAVADKAGKYLIINGSRISVGDIFVTSDKELVVDTAALGSEAFRPYYAKGYKTSAQMKYATAFTDSFTISEKGYYTIVAQGENRERYVFYIYIY